MYIFCFTLNVLFFGICQIRLFSLENYNSKWIIWYFLILLWIGVYTVCEDKIDRCSLYGPDICFKYTTWAAVQCPKFCVFCERKINTFLLISKYLVIVTCLRPDISFRKSYNTQMINTIILKITNLTPIITIL